MRIMLLAGALITLPAMVVAGSALFFGRVMMIPALVSLAINLVPFLAAGMLLRGRSAGSVMTH